MRSGGFRSFTNDINNKQIKPGQVPTYENFKNTYKNASKTMSMGGDPFENSGPGNMPQSVQTQKEQQLAFAKEGQYWEQKYRDITVKIKDYKDEQKKYT